MAELRKFHRENRMFTLKHVPEAVRWELGHPIKAKLFLTVSFWKNAKKNWKPNIKEKPFPALPIGEGIELFRTLLNFGREGRIDSTIGYDMSAKAKVFGVCIGL